MYQVLPHNFAERVIELECLLDDNRCIDLVKDLNELYCVRDLLCRLLLITMFSINPKKLSIFRGR